MVSEMSYEIIELEITRWASSVRLKPHQMQRDLRRSGKTSLAAARLCAYRLRRTLQVERMQAVDDITLHVLEDFPHDTRLIAADVRVIKRTPGVNLPENFRVPKNSHTVKAVRIP